MPYDDLFDELAVPALEEHLGESFTQYPAGVAASAVPDLTVTFLEDEPQRDFAEDEVTYEADLLVNADITVDPADRWIRDSDSTTWETIAIGKVDGGIRMIRVRRDEGELTDGEDQDVL